MPTYLLECTRCGKQEEKLFTKIVRFKEPKQSKPKGYHVVEKRKPPLHYPKCSFCGGDQILLPSLVAMQPDPYWSGQIKHGRYVTKKSQIPKQIEPATRANVEHVEKRKVEVAKEREEKSSNNLKKFLKEQLADVEVGPGATDA